MVQLVNSQFFADNICYLTDIVREITENEQAIKCLEAGQSVVNVHLAICELY